MVTMQALQQLFAGIDFVTVLAAALITTLIVSAINVVENQVPNKALVALVAAVVTLLSTTFVPGADFAHWQRLVLQMIVTIAFAILFYTYLGGTFIDRLFRFVKNYINQKLGTNPPEEPK